MWQANWCAGELRKHGIEVELTIIRTGGDLVRDRSIVNIGAQGVFTKEIQQALLRDEIDLAVHSLKDLPTEPVPGLALAAVPKRGPHHDVFLGRDAKSPDELPAGARIGTGSLRRRTQLIHRYGDRFQLDEIRGNVETRLEKLDRGEYDALILAEAGLVRLGFADRIDHRLDEAKFLPAVGQGALGLEIRADDRETAQCLSSISDQASLTAVLAERAFLRTLQGGCIAPIAALASVRDEILILHGRILSLDGRTMFESIRSWSDLKSPESLGIALARELAESGAESILEEIRLLRRPSD